MDFRHEWKYELAPQDIPILRSRLRAVMRVDSHAIDGKYRIRSLYFDTPEDRALQENLAGVSRREKFRIRYYNGDLSLFHLEKKSKVGGLGHKDQACVTEKEVAALLSGDLYWMREDTRPLVQELYRKMRTTCLAPKTLVEYTREPFVYAPGNVRVTLDENIRTSLSCRDFLRPDCVTIPAGDAPNLLEVKWDAFLPDVIRAAVLLEGRRVGAFSKYAQCRIYG